MGDLNKIIIGGRIKPGTIDSGEKITDGEVSHRWTYFILAVAGGGNWKEYVKCVLYGKIADAYGKVLRDDAKVFVWGALQIRPGKGGRYYANIVVEGLHILEGFEHEVWESRPERDATIPMQDATEVDNERDDKDS